MDHGEESPYCYFHPKVKIVGVCAPCLKERLLILASKQRRHPLPEDERRTNKNLLCRKPSNSLHKVFALGSLLHRLELRPQKRDISTHDTNTSTSNEDSFISIKFEDNGRVSWDKGRRSWTSSEAFELPSNQCLNKEIKMAKSVVEHAKTGSAALRWPKRLGQLLQLVRWRRSGKGGGVHMSTKVEGVKGRKGWIKAITKKKARE